MLVSVCLVPLMFLYTLDPCVCLLSSSAISNLSVWLYVVASVSRIGRGKFIEFSPRLVTRLINEIVERNIFGTK